MSETPHLTSFRKQFALNKLSAAHRMRVVGDKVEKYEPAPPARDIEEVLADHIFTPGQMVAGRGIFVGTWEPYLSKTFNVFAAPEDLGGKQQWHTYKEALEGVAALEGWHGHDGAGYPTERELYQALANDTYNGGWIIPTREILFGSGGTLADNLLAHKDTGVFKDAFDRDVDEYDGFPNWYWSFSRSSGAQEAYAVACFTEKRNSWHPPDTRGPCRPVRLEPKP